MHVQTTAPLAENVHPWSCLLVVSALLVKLAGAADRIGSIYPAYFPFKKGITVIGAPVRWDQSILRVRDIKNTRSHFTSRLISRSSIVKSIFIVIWCCESSMRVYPENTIKMNHPKGKKNSTIPLLIGATFYSGEGAFRYFMVT